MENNNELLENVTEVILEEEVVTKPNTGLVVAVAIGLGVTVGTLIYRKFKKSRRQADDIIEVEEVEPAEIVQE